MPARRTSIVVIGSAIMDVITRASAMPASGETLIGTGVAVLPGGKGANQAIAAARLGASVHFIGRIGGDVFGDALFRSLTDAGVNVDHARRDPSRPTGVASVRVDEKTGENSIVVVLGANSGLGPADIAGAEAQIADADTVLCSMEVPPEAIEAAVMTARRHGVRTIVNPAPARELSQAMLGAITILTPNEHEAAALTGGVTRNPLAAGKMLVEQGAGTVVVTLGKDGAAAVTGANSGDLTIMRSLSFAVEPVVDTTGAGDCFSAALTVAVAEGQGLAEALRFANAAAGISVTRVGAAASMPHRDEVERLLLSACRSA